MSTQIGPGLRDYLSSLENKLRRRGLSGPLLVMQSNGGAVATAEAPAHAISTVGSVLTGGVIGSVSLRQQLGHKNTRPHRRALGSPQRPVPRHPR
jgi:N-methylhydantoinase A